MTVCGTFVLLMSVSCMVAPFCNVKLSPVTFVLSVAIQVNVVPVTFVVRFMASVFPLHKIAVFGFVKVTCGYT